MTDLDDPDEKNRGSKMKKIVVAITLIGMLVTLALPCSAADEPVVSGECLSEPVGGIVEYHVAIADNPGLSGFLIRLTYDTDVLSVITADDGKTVEAERGDLSSGSLMGSKTANGCQVLWYSVSEESCDGTLFTLRFKISENAPIADYPVKISYSQQNTVNAAGDLIRLRCEDGCISVREYAPTLYGSDATVELGEEFEYSVFLKDNPGLAACGFTLRFDPGSFELVRSPDSGEPVCSTGEAFSGGVLSAKGYQNAVVIFWYQYQNTTESGKFVTIRLRAKETADIGETVLRLEMNTGQTVDEEERELSLSAMPGTVYVQAVTHADVQILDSNQAQIRVTTTAASRVVVAFYEPSGRLAAAAAAVTKDHAAGMTVETQQADLQTCSWKLFLLDEQYRPICAALQSGS